MVSVSARLHAGTGAPHSAVGNMCRWNIPASPAVETEAILDFYGMLSRSLEDSTQQRSKKYSHVDCRRRNRMMMSRNFNICTRSQRPEARNINAKREPPLHQIPCFPISDPPSSIRPLPYRDTLNSRRGHGTGLYQADPIAKSIGRTRLLYTVLRHLVSALEQCQRRRSTEYAWSTWETPTRY